MKNHQKHIAGVAMGAAALGHGALEDIKRALCTDEDLITKNRIFEIETTSLENKILEFLEQEHGEDLS